MKHLEGLNTEQRSAVEFIDGPQLIIAGAGSGKTRVLTHKIIHLLYSGYKPQNILALTFTNKAAREMKERMLKLIDKTQISGLWMGTFHSIFARILRIEGEVLGYPRTFTIYDTDDSRRLLKEIIKDLKLDSERYPAREIFARISKAKNNLVLPSTYENSPTIQQQDIYLKRPDTYLVYRTYQSRMKKAGAMDFDDLLVNTNILFRDFPDILEKYQKIFKYILVDEYQDTNYAQYIIIKKLSADNKKLCVVGDDSQSIYAFRGANIENIFKMQQDFPDLETFKLERNYRSTKNIVNLANSLIEKNTNRIPKEVYTDNETGSKIIIKELPSDKAEAYFVAKTINKFVNAQKADYQDIAVLYRTNAQSRNFESILRKFSIPYKLYGSTSFYQRAEIKNIVAYLRLLVNSQDDQAFKRIINFPKRGIGATTITKLSDLATKSGKSMWDTLLELRKYGSIFNAGTISKLNKFKRLIDELRAASEDKEVKELVDFVVEKTGIKREMSAERTPEGISRYENIQEFINAIQDYADNKKNEGETPTLETFLEEIALTTDQDNDKNDINTVTLMTIHASKGLEFKIVFIVGVEEYLFPSFRSISEPKMLEEERRLFYVAITRCEQELFITYAQNRMKWGKMQASSPSRFLRELNPKYIDFQKEAEENDKKFDNSANFDNFANEKKGLNQQNFQHSKPQKLEFVSKTEATKIIKKQTDKTTGISVGMKVEHKKFGVGTVLQLEGTGANTKAMVDFKTVGKKNLLLKFAKLNIVNN